MYFFHFFFVLWTGSKAFPVALDRCNGRWHSNWVHTFHLYDNYGCGRLRQTMQIYRRTYFNLNFISAVLRSNCCDDVHHWLFPRVYQCKWHNYLILYILGIRCWKGNQKKSLKKWRNVSKFGRGSDKFFW